MIITSIICKEYRFGFGVDGWGQIFEKWQRTKY
jgi:hypothetical protein